MLTVDWLTQTLAPHYTTLKFVHLLFATMWLWSTSVAYINYVVPAVRRWLADPHCPEHIDKRNEALERFDNGVVLEHIAFPIVLLSGLLLLLVGPWGLHNGWLITKLCLIVLVFIPIEVYDYWLSHFGGNKRRARLASGLDARDCPRYEALVRTHIWFLTVTTPVIAVAGVTVVYLATAKPV